MTKTKFLFFIGLFSFLNLWVSLLPAQTSADEYMAISKTLSYYLDGGTYNDFPQLAKAFHKDATMKHVGDQYKAVNALDFFEKGIKPGPPSDRKTKIVSINFNGKAANAVLHIDYPTSRFWDFMNLLKIDGEWQIVSKIFYIEQLEKENPAPAILSEEEKEVLTVLHEWRMAYIHQKAEVVEKILAEEWTYSGGSEGQIVDKQTALKDIRNAKAAFLEINFQNLSIRKAGGVIFVSGQEELKIKEKGQIKSSHLRFTDAYQKKGDRWQAIFTHSSTIKK